MLSKVISVRNSLCVAVVIRAVSASEVVAELGIPVNCSIPIFQVTRQHMDDCKKLLRLMGIPVVEAPTEAEAQCASLVKAGKVFAAATEDMDALTFASTRLLRHMTFSEARKMPIQEFVLEKILMVS